MSDIHLGLPFSSCDGRVDHSVGLAQDIGNLFMNCEYSDVVLVVGGQRFYAHKVILAARSNYFRAMMYGGMQESHQDEIEIKVANLTAFKVLLKYIYKGHITLNTEKEETVHEILALSNQYGFEELEGAVCDFLKETLSVANFCTIYDLSLLYSLSDLRAVCEDFLDKNAPIIVCHSSMKTLSPGALKSIISRDSFCAPEVDIFGGVRDWVQANEMVDKAVVNEILGLVRLPLMSILDLLNVVRPSQLFSPDTILDAIKAKNESRDIDLRYRGYLVAEENVATPAMDAVVLTGEMRNNLLDGNTTNYDMDRGFTRHSIDDSPRHILVRLGRPCIVNHLRLVLWDKDPRSYSYYIEVSMDQKDWIRVVDHTCYHCRSWQYLYFPARAVRYIKVVGTNNTVNRVFHLVALEAYFTKQQVMIHQGLLVPTSNVALVSRSSVVIEGVSRSRNNLLNGDVTNYDWDSGYTCHQLGSGSICVQLGQPYWLGSLRLLLWDCDDRSYSYYIQSSVNGRDWEKVVDKTREACRSWQVIHFTPRPVVYFKIVGVLNTANEVFHCVHFECPASTVDCPILENLPSCEIANIMASPAPGALSSSPSTASNGSNSNEQISRQQEPNEEEVEAQPQNIGECQHAIVDGHNRYGVNHYTEENSYDNFQDASSSFRSGSFQKTYKQQRSYECVSHCTDIDGQVMRNSSLENVPEHFRYHTADSMDNAEHLPRHGKVPYCFGRGRDSSGAQSDLAVSALSFAQDNEASEGAAIGASNRDWNGAYGVFPNIQENGGDDFNSASDLQHRGGARPRRSIQKECSIHSQHESHPKDGFCLIASELNQVPYSQASQMGASSAGSAHISVLHTTQSSPTHSEVSGSRASCSPTCSENSHWISSRQAKRLACAGSSSCGGPFCDMVRYESLLLANSLGSRAAEVEELHCDLGVDDDDRNSAELKKSPVNSGVYHRPSSPLAAVAEVLPTDAFESSSEACEDEEKSHNEVSKEECI